MARQRVYFYWRCFWSVEKSLTALAKHYKIDYVDDADDEVLRVIFLKALMEYRGIRNNTIDGVQTNVEQSLVEYRKQNLIPAWVQREVYYLTCEARTPGFDLTELIGQPPYKSDWEIPRAVTAGEMLPVRVAA